MIVRPVNGARFDSVRGWGTGKEKMVEEIANKQQEWKQKFMVGTYMKQIKIKGHNKLLRRYTSKKFGKLSLGFLNRVITFKKCPVFFQNRGGWDRIGTKGMRGPPHKKGVTDRKSLDT